MLRQLLAGCAALAILPAAASGSCDTYAHQLRIMAEVDQAMREHWNEVQIPVHAKSEAELPLVVRQTMLVDRVNTARLKALVAACGWPSRSTHGTMAVDDAWLLAQHADADLAFRETVLTLLERGVAAGDLPASHLAYFSDRLALSKHQPQRYGTQLRQSGACEYTLEPVDDLAAVDARRKALGWPPVAAYIRLVNEQSQGPACRLR